MEPAPDRNATPTSNPACSWNEAQERALERVLAGKPLLHSPRLRELLRDLAAASSRGALDELKEQAIGSRVFGRPVSYNSSEDNIVRVTVRQLRARLQEYYDTPEGRADLWRVEIPKGGYVVNIREASLDSPAFASPASAPARIPRLAIAVIAVVAAAAALLLAYNVGRRTQAAGSARPDTLLQLLTPSSTARVSVVLGDEGLMLYRRLTGKVVSLDEYIRGAYLQSPDMPSGPYGRAIADYLATQTTSFYSTVFLGRVLECMPAGTVLRHARAVNVRDFETDSALLIAGPFVNPWAQLFEDRLNFAITIDPGVLTSYIRNRSPRPGEQEVYRHTQAQPGSILTYARIAYLPALAGAGKVMLAGGPHASSTEAAVRFLTDPASIDELRARFAIPAGAPMPGFELLLESRESAGAPVQLRLVAHRLLPPGARTPGSH